MKGDTRWTSGKDTLSRRNSMHKDMEVGKSINCSGNCKEVAFSKPVTRDLAGEEVKS